MTDERPVIGDERAATRAALRKATLQLVLGVVALDALALAIWYAGGVSHAATQTRMIFTVAWTMATAATVAVLLRRVRAARYGR